MNRNSKLPCCKTLLTLFSACLLSPTLMAQGTNSEAGEPGEDEVVFMSVFEIDATKDDRYRAANSVSATGLNTPIKELPMTIQVITGEFIDDLGATDFDEALTYAAGVNTDDMEASSGGGGSDANRAGGSQERSPSTASSSTRFANTVNIRGFNTPFQNRLGFRYGGVVITPNSSIAMGGLLDSSNIDRMEVVKGPNSILYGIGVISGIVNVIPKKPLSEQRQKFTFTGGSNNFLRGTADITGPIIRSGEDSKHRLNYRIMGAYENRDDWTDFRTKEVKYGALQLDYWYGNQWNVFGEVQSSNVRYEGTGAQWYYDDLTRAFSPEFRNEYDEQYNFGQDGTIAGPSPVEFRPDPRRGRREDYFEVSDIDSRQLNGGTLPDSYRITGPDTYEERDEMDLLLDVGFFPSENLAFSTGVFYTEASEEELAVTVRNMNGREGSFNIRSELPAFYEDIPSSEFAGLLWALKNEVSEDYIPDYDPEQIQSYDDYKLTRYWWSLRPQESESFQWRIKGTYNFETPFLFETRTENTILFGYNYISDKVDFLDDDETLNRAHISRNNPYVRDGQIDIGDAASMDALYFRSIDDLSPIRYTGQNLAMPGEAFRHQDVFYHGAYGILQSKFWEDRIEFIAGIRYDRYNAETKDLIRFSDEDIAIGVSETSGWVDNPLSVVFSEGEPVKSFEEDVEATSLSFGINYDINKAMTVYGLYAEGISPNTSLTDGNNTTIPAENTRSIEAGFKWDAFEGRLSGTLAIFEIQRENAIWQWSEAPSPSKWVDSPNPPPGDSISGTEFNTTPTNGLRLSYGVDGDFISDDIKDYLFSRLRVEGIDEPGLSNAQVVVDPVTGERTRLYGLFNVENHQAGSLQPFNRRNVWWVDYQNLDVKQTINMHVPDPDGDITHEGQTYRIQTVDVNFREYIENAFAAIELHEDNIGQFNPIRYAATPVPSGANKPGNTPSTTGSQAGGDTFVTFSDTSRGVDLEFIYSPSPSLQLIFNYSHIDRKAEGSFNMVDWTDLNTGVSYGTEYDEIYRILGRENAGITGTDTDGDGVLDHFVDIRGNEIGPDNPALPTDFYSGIDGLSLFFNSKDQASLWTRYSFLDGPVKGLGLSGGIRYYGPAQTSIPIGGSNLGQNLFQTPDTEERWTVDLGFYYSFRAFGDLNWRLSLNIYNLLDNTEGLTTSTVTDPYTGREVTTRTRRLYAPRSFRFGVAVDF